MIGFSDIRWLWWKVSTFPTRKYRPNFTRASFRTMRAAMAASRKVGRS